MNQKYPIKAFDGTNTADVSVLNLPAGSVGANGEIDLGVGVKVYRALLTQTGTDAPVATVLENTLGGTPVWTYQNVGIYRALLTDAFPENTTTVFTGDRSGSTASVPSTQLFRRSDFELQLEVGDYNIVYNDPHWELEWAGGDDLLLSFPVMVIVNP